MLMFKSLFAEQDVNTGRQIDFDYLKGIALIFIFVIHSFQASRTPMDDLVRALFVFCSMFEAGLFIFVAGFGTVYSKNSSPENLAKNGVILTAEQYASNMLYIYTGYVSYLILKDSFTPEGLKNLERFMKVYTQFLNIFFITGIIYLCLAVFKKFKCSAPVYFICGVLFTLLAPWLYEQSEIIVPAVKNFSPALAYVINALIGKDYFISFTPFFFMPYALIGISAGLLYKRINNKFKFYKISALVCFIIALAWWAWVFYNNNDLNAIYNYVIPSYKRPGLLYVTASISHVFLFAALIYFIQVKFKALNSKLISFIKRELLYFSKHISKFYALHIAVYILFYGLHGMLPFQTWQAWLLILPAMALTDIIIRIYNYIINL